jgi:hypothetical protein
LCGDSQAPSNLARLRAAAFGCRKRVLEVVKTGSTPDRLSDKGRRIRTIILADMVRSLAVHAFHGRQDANQWILRYEAVALHADRT